MADGYKLIDERIGLFGGVALLVGTAVGMSIFVVPTQSVASAGPAAAIAVLAAIPPMVLGVLMLLQLGGAIPVAGGVYVYGSRLVSPYWGFVGVALPVFAIWAYLLFAGIGFAQYLDAAAGLLPWALELPPLAAIWFLLGVFLLLNYVGVRIVTQVQFALVAGLVVGMLTFIAGGAAAFDPGNFTPLFPDGPGEPFDDGVEPFLLAMVMLYIPFQGFSMIIEIGEELEDPIRNIPRVLAIGMSIVTVLSVAVVIALVGAVPWRLTIDSGTGEPIEGGLATAAALAGALPDAAVAVVALGALIAAATTVNTLLTSYSRTVMRAARDDVVPVGFAAIHDRFGTPHRAILLMGLPPIVAAPFRGWLDALVPVDVLDWLVVVIVTGIFVGFVIGGVALWRLPQEFPDRYEHSFYRLPLPLLRVVAVGNVAVSLLFTAFVATSAPSALAVVLAVLVLIYPVYRYRVLVHERRGVDIRARMASLDSHE